MELYAKNTANGGLCLRFAGKTLLIDPLHAGAEPLWPAVPEDTRRAVLEGLPPFGRPDLLLLTHKHPDHFSPEDVLELLRRQPQLKAVAPQWIVTKLLAGGAAEEQLLCAAPERFSQQEFSVASLRVCACATQHDSMKYRAVEHISYSIECSAPAGLRILVAGDAMPTDENCRAMELERGADLMICNFPWLTLASARQKAAGYPLRQRLFVHFPRPVAEGELYLREAERQAARLPAQTPAVLLETPGQEATILI